MESRLSSAKIICTVYLYSKFVSRYDYLKPGFRILLESFINCQLFSSPDLELILRFFSGGGGGSGGVGGITLHLIQMI